MLGEGGRERFAPEDAARREAPVGFRRNVACFPICSIRQHTSAYASIRQHASAYVSIRQHTSAYASRRQNASAGNCLVDINPFLILLYMCVRMRIYTYMCVRMRTYICMWCVREHAAVDALSSLSLALPLSLSPHTHQRARCRRRHT